VCHNSAALAAPFLYHDPAKELAFIFLPMQLGLKDADQQRIIGQLTNALMSRMPAEKRKAYLLTPKQFFTLQSLLEAILEADGITKEMMQAQEAKLQLLRQMVETQDASAQEALIREHDADVDVAFFRLLNAALISAQADRADNELQQLTALHDRLLELTTVGKKIRAQQETLQALQAKPDRETLLEQLIRAPDAETRELLLAFGRPLLDYQFFQALTAKIEAANAAGSKDEAERLTALRREILSFREELDAATKALLDKRANLLRELLISENLDETVRAHLNELDEAFFSVLDLNMQAAEQARQQATFDRLQAVAEAAARAIAAAQPPEVRFVNALLSAPYPDETRKLLEANRRALSPQLLEWMRGLAEDLRQDGRADAADLLLKIVEQATQIVGEAAAAPAASAESAPPPVAPAVARPQILIAKR